MGLYLSVTASNVKKDDSMVLKGEHNLKSIDYKLV
jgi:hypothetical protein